MARSFPQTPKTRTVVVGSGPGGATVARELARRGEAVIVLEKGRDHQWPVGRIFAYATMYDIRKSRGGVLVRRGITTGGSTMLYSGNAYDPPSFLKDEVGLDLESEVAETKTELSIKPVPEYFYKNYTGTLRLVEAADRLGFAMRPQQRFIDPEKCDPTCDRCLFGCRRGAKWTARSFLYEAVDHGAELMTECEAERVLMTDGAAEGIEARHRGDRLRIMADRVVLAAGGIGTPVILQKSGIREAGNNFFTDPMSILVGVMPDNGGTFHEMTYTFADETDAGNYVIGNVGAVNGLMAQLAALNIGWLRRAIRMKRVAGMFVKLCDEPSGRVDINGRLHKSFTDRDETKMAQGVAKAKEIMTAAGVIPESIAIAKGIGGHPGGTAAINTVVGNDLQTRIRNLYVCDNSVMPRSGGIPPVLTIIAMAKQASRTILV